MRNKLFTLLGTLGMVTSCIAAGAVGAPAEAMTVALRGTPHDALFDLAFDGRIGVAVGAHGSVYRSDDGGTRWRRSPELRSDVALLGVAVRGGRCIAVGQQGTVLTSPDCIQWTVAAPVTAARLTSVAMNRRGLAYAVGAFGTLLKSDDAGRHWQVVPIDWSRIGALPAEPHLYAVHVDDDDGVVVAGEFELILRSTDGGAQWKLLHRGERSLFGLRLLEGGRGYAVGQSGALLSTLDGGATWRSLPTGMQSILTGIDADANGRVVLSGVNVVALSSDGGASWRQLPSRAAIRGWQQSVARAVDAQGRPRFLTAGAGGTILQINDEEVAK
ncbi:YCF48-related protein [Aquincola sp. MAHUQ-54]|uniref:YCF48-related protein n=1 Tax=Aquincola agrisoli TaxID=3119538 RepID=A0AAW9QFF0_9BURK